MFKIQIKESNQVLDLCRYSNGYRGWGEYSSFENASNVKVITSEIITFETQEEAEEVIKNGKQMLRGAFVVEVLEPREQEILDKVLLDSENDIKKSLLSLEDGAYLESINVLMTEQIEVEQVYYYLKSLL